jgi:hypothetical protein
MSRSSDVRTTVSRSTDAQNVAPSTVRPAGSVVSTDDARAAVIRDRDRPLAERVAALAGRGPAAASPQAVSRSAESPSVDVAATPVRPMVAAIAGGHAARIDRSTASAPSPVAARGAVSDSPRLIRSARSEQVRPVALPAPRTPVVVGGADVVPSPSPSGSSSGVRRSATTASTSSSSRSRSVSRSASTGAVGAAIVGRADDGGTSASSAVDSAGRSGSRVVRSRSALQRRADRPVHRSTPVVSRSASETAASAPPAPTNADRIELTDHLLEALEDRIMRALERRGGIQRGWF